MIALIQILEVLLDVLWWIIVVDIVLSLLIAFNVINRHSDFVRTVTEALRRITEPMYRPIRRVLPDFGMFDFSPMVILVLIQCLDIVLGRLALSLATGAPM